MHVTTHAPATIPNMEQWAESIKQNLHWIVTIINNSPNYPNIWRQLLWKLQKAAWNVCVCVCTCVSGWVIQSNTCCAHSTNQSVVCLQGLSCCWCTGWWWIMNDLTVVSWQRKCNSAHIQYVLYTHILAHRCTHTHKCAVYTVLVNIFTVYCWVQSSVWKTFRAHSKIKRTGNGSKGQSAEVMQLKTEWICHVSSVYCVS